MTYSRDMNTTSTAAATAASIFTGPVSRYLIADLERGFAKLKAAA